MMTLKEFKKAVEQELAYGNAYVVCYEDEITSTFEEPVRPSFGQDFIWFENGAYDQDELKELYSLYCEKF